MSTTDKPMRFVMGGIIHETNTYAADVAGQTPLASFEQYCGDEIPGIFTGSNHQVGGYIEGARKHGARLIHTFLGQATPSGTIEGNAYAHMKQAILAGIEQALPIDGVLLALHGAGVADGIEDIEGDLAAAVRTLVGPHVPIAAAYDLHGNMTGQMQHAVDIALPCILYPHTDFYDRGIECVDLMVKMIRGEVKPVTHVCTLPMLPYIVTTNEGFVPARVNELCAQLEALPGVLDCSWFHGFPYADIASPCPAAICTTNGDPALAIRCAEQVAQWIWDHREDFRPQFPSPAEGVARALATSAGPVVINEYADNPGGGTPGDGTYLLRALLDAAPVPDTVCFASINDAEVVRQVIAVGVGGTLRVSLGGKLGRFQGAPIEAEAYVKAITDGRFVNRPGSMFDGVRFDLGAMCRLVIKGVDIIVASRAEQIYDMEPFALHGIDAGKRKIIALKGANHFRAGFKGLVEDIITVDSMGLSTANITSFPRHHLKSMLWPLHEGVVWGAFQGCK